MAFNFECVQHLLHSEDGQPLRIRTGTTIFQRCSMMRRIKRICRNHFGSSGHCGSNHLGTASSPV